MKLLRIHQWAKNLLLFLPMLLSDTRVQESAIIASILAFLSFGLGASGLYVFNDVIDLPFDRAHLFKRHRPLARGIVSVTTAWVVSLILVSLAVGLGLLLPRSYLFCLFAYFAISITYTLGLKRQYLLDVVILSTLYALRIQAGSMATGIVVSRWVLSFSLLFFLSLALLKRYTELVESSSDSSCPLPGRPYGRVDLPWLRAIGPLSGCLAVVMIGGYLGDPRLIARYSHPQWLWTLGPLAVFWIIWVWRKATRGEMHHDPLVFLLRDPVSLGTAALALLTMATAQA